MVVTTWTLSQDSWHPKLDILNKKGAEEGVDKAIVEDKFHTLHIFSETGDAPRSQEYIRSVS